MKKTIRIVVTVLLLLLAVPSTAVFALGLAENGIISWDAFRSVAISSGWNESVRRHIRDGFEPLNDVTDVPKELTDAFLEEEVSDDLCAAFWSADGIEFPGDELQSRLTERIRAYAKRLREDGEIHVTEEEWQDLLASCPGTASYYVNVIRNAVMISSWSGALKNAAELWSKYYPLLLAMAGVTSLGSLGLLALIYKRRFPWLAYAALSGAGLTLLLPAIWLTASDFAVRLQFDPEYLKAFVVRFYECFCKRMLIAALVLTFVGAACGVLSLVLKKKNKEKKDDPTVSGESASDR